MAMGEYHIMKKNNERTMLMKKRVLSFALVLVLALSLCTPASVGG